MGPPCGTSMAVLLETRRQTATARQGGGGAAGWHDEQSAGGERMKRTLRALQPLARSTRGGERNEHGPHLSGGAREQESIVFQ